MNDERREKCGELSEKLYPLFEAINLTRRFWSELKQELEDMLEEELATDNHQASIMNLERAIEGAERVDFIRFRDQLDEVDIPLTYIEEDAD